MYRPLYKKIDYSAFDGYITIPKDLMKDFMGGRKLPVSSARDVTIIWGNRKYACAVRHARPKRPYMMIRYENNREFLKKLRETFIYSYVVFKSQKEKSDEDEDSQFRSHLEKGEREVMIFQPVSHNVIKAKVFIKIENEWNHLFQRLANENVFGWLFETDNSYLISESSKWKSVREFKKAKHKINVIYYLLHTSKKLIYIGKAEVLGKRVQPGRDHQGMPGDWDKFRYDVVMPEYQSLLGRLEDHTIRSFASIFQNTKGFLTAGLSGYTLVNANWRKL